MGTQQILLIVLSVIISMFNNQAFNNNQQAVASELQNYSIQVVQFFKTPEAHGGAGRLDLVTLERIATFIGFSGSSRSLQGAYRIKSDNGEYRLTGYNSSTVQLMGLGTETKDGLHPLIVATVTIATGEITSIVSKATSLDF
jgi:hypothetical protein